MKIACIQKDIHLGDIVRNTDAFLPEVESLSNDNYNIIMLPEMWATGFDYHNLQSHSKNTDNLIKEIAKITNKNSLVISSLPENDSDKIYNTIFAINSEGIVSTYRKNFLFSPLKEDQYFSKGNSYSIFNFNNTRISLHTCYEIRFPELFRIAAFNGSQLMLVPAIWPAEKKEHWMTMLKARAIENQCFVVGCNTSNAHTTKKTIKCGISLVVDPWGNILNEAAPGVESIIKAEIDLNKCNEVREKIPSLKDASEVFDIKKKSILSTNKEE